MAMYTFYVCDQAGLSTSFEAFELRTDATSIIKAGELIEQHPSCDHIEVWREERPFLVRHREQPILRSVIWAA